MNPVAVPAIMVSAGVPLAFLYLVRRLDLYATGGFRIVVGCFLWGLVSFWLSLGANTWALGWASLVMVVVLVAPVVEETVKSLALVYYEKRPEFTYFVDGAIYGFAAGTGFAVIENLWYLTRVGSETAMGLSINRAFSTSLMHGSATALVGIALGRLQYGPPRVRYLALGTGLATAMGLHILFNWLNQRPLAEVIGGLLFLGLGGVGLVALFVLWGLREERQWLRETLTLQVGVSGGEARVVDRLKELSILLAPVGEHFGPEKQVLVEEFLRLQARLGLLQRASQMESDPARAAELRARVADMQTEMDHLRREVGAYCMVYVRSIVPAESEPLWAHLESVLVDQPAGGVDMWSVLDERSNAAPAPDLDAPP
jgi:RsiW-degrading membrane proteinase PrsW (M82 family)